MRPTSHEVDDNLKQEEAVHETYIAWRLVFLLSIKKKKKGVRVPRNDRIHAINMAG